MVTTQQMRNAWSPACTGPWVTLNLHGEGRVSVRTAVVDAVRALNAILVKYDYKTRRNDTGAYNCRKITGGSGYSLHAYGIAMDINWSTNPYGKRLITDMPPAMIAEIKALKTKNGKQLWRWGGDYSGNKDAMHFEVICTPVDLATGITGSTKPEPKPTDVKFKKGDKGNGVKFLQSMLNILWKERINSKGKAGGARITVDGSYGAQTQEAVREIQRFGIVMQKLSGQKVTIKVTGTVDTVTLNLIAFFVPIVTRR